METASKIWSFINAQEPKVMNTTYIYIEMENNRSTNNRRRREI